MKKIFTTTGAIKTVGLLAVVGLLGYAVVSAGLITSYSNDKDTLRFGFDLRDSYVVGQSMPLEVSLVDTNTGTKPQGTSVLMSVNGGSFNSILDENTTRSSRIVNLDSYNLAEGSHYITFASPGSCGNYFDYSDFDGPTRFENIYDCQYKVSFNVTDGSNPGGRCTDENANNTGSSASCTYDEIFGCTNSAATNYNAGATNNDGSCVFTTVLGCTDITGSNYVPTATTDDGSCEYYEYGCTDSRANNYDSGATAEDGSCDYPGEVTESDFECSVDNATWVECEGRTFALNTRNDPIYVQTVEVQSAGDWSDWCTGDLNNGVQASFFEISGSGDNARVNFTFSEPGSLFDMVLCLDPDSPSKALSFKNIKIKLAEAVFVEE